MQGPSPALEKKEVPRDDGCIFHPQYKAVWVGKVDSSPPALVGKEGCAEKCWPCTPSE